MVYDYIVHKMFKLFEDKVYDKESLDVNNKNFNLFKLFITVSAILSIVLNLLFFWMLIDLASRYRALDEKYKNLGIEKNNMENKYDKELSSCIKQLNDNQSCAEVLKECRLEHELCHHK